MYALNIAKDGRILSATYPQYVPEGAVIVEALPAGNITDYKYTGGEFIFEPLPEPEQPEPMPSDNERIAALEDELAAAKILLGVE